MVIHPVNSKFKETLDCRTYRLKNRSSKNVYQQYGMVCKFMKRIRNGLDHCNFDKKGYMSLLGVFNALVDVAARELLISKWALEQK